MEFREFSFFPIIFRRGYSKRKYLCNRLNKKIEINSRQPQCFPLFLLLLSLYLLFLRDFDHFKDNQGATRRRSIQASLFKNIIYQYRFYGIFWKILSSRIVGENLFLIIYEEREIYNKSIAMCIEYSRSKTGLMKEGSRFWLQINVQIF